MLDENRIKPLSVLKDDPGFAKLNWFSLFRLKTPLEKFSSRNDLSLRSTGVTFPSGKMGRTSLDYVPCISEAWARGVLPIRAEESVTPVDLSQRSFLLLNFSRGVLSLNRLNQLSLAKPGSSFSRLSGLIPFSSCMSITFLCRQSSLDSPNYSDFKYSSSGFTFPYSLIVGFRRIHGLKKIGLWRRLL